MNRSPIYTSLSFGTQQQLARANQIPQLSSIIEERAKVLGMGSSWEAV